ncbi:galactofuranosyltransferase [Prevotella cerevisiae]|uniref:Galactofuranosyltransferase n=1 Tax=Segatella cerevisiae TaxID=2053716 RepID=A0ABT1BX08_9BACT|nr:galactofuranosyltransferase [Segatella cerevisiae]MCO6025612.1 galactofuranosyltransferase [Segatella cerevisiae]
MTNRLCYISRNYRGVTSSGSKAKTDNEITLLEMGAHNLGLPSTYYRSKIITFFLDLLGIFKLVMTIKPNDILVLQYPVKKYFSFICNIAHRHGAKTVTVIHDLGCMRRKKLSEDQEIHRLMHSDYVIASNESMASWLRDHGYQHPLYALGLFDYRSEACAHFPELINASHQLFTLVYAGSLAMRKNSFLLKIQPQIKNYQLQIYGDRDGLPELKDSNYLHVNGFMDSDDFIKHVKGDFGLVWDGDSLDTCSGSFGEYLHWNSPHKVSFYLRAGLPVIVWQDAAVAPIIQEEGIGICIKRLSELNNLLPKISDQKIYEMRKNVYRVSERLRKGGYLKTVLETVMNREAVE